MFPNSLGCVYTGSGNLTGLYLAKGLFRIYGECPGFLFTQEASFKLLLASLTYERDINMHAIYANYFACA